MQSGKLTIPEDERFIGFTGDDQSTEVELLIKHFFVPNSTYTLCLRFDDGTERLIPLSGAQILDDMLLTWNVCRDELYSAGIVTAQLRINSGDGRVIHSSRDYFLVGGAGSDDAEAAYVTHGELETELGALSARLPYVNDEGAFIVADGGDIRIAEADGVYTKAQIDDMIGDLEEILEQV